MSKGRFTEYKTLILNHFSTDEPYLQNNYTLAKLSEETKIPKHLLSPIFSEEFEMNFTEFVNSYRIQKATQLLKDQPNITVSAISYDCGFNTLFPSTWPLNALQRLHPLFIGKPMIVELTNR